MVMNIPRMAGRIKASSVNVVMNPNFDIVKTYCVQHPTNGNEGALCRNKTTGIYVIVLADTIYSCPQDWAKSLDETI